MKYKTKHKSGKIIPNGVLLEKHELDMVLVFTQLGYNVEFIVASSTPHSKTPDVIIAGKAWEMKSPVGCSKSTLEHCFKKAAKQSENLIIDLRRIKIEEFTAMSQLENLFQKSKRVKKLKIISKKGKVIDF